MSFIKTKKTTTTLDAPQGYLYTEGLIAQMEKIQQMQLVSKQHSLTQYGGPDFDALLKVMAKQVETEITSMQTFMAAQETTNDPDF